MNTAFSAARSFHEFDGGEDEPAERGPGDDRPAQDFDRQAGAENLELRVDFFEPCVEIASSLSILASSLRTSALVASSEP